MKPHSALARLPFSGLDSCTSIPMGPPASSSLHPASFHTEVFLKHRPGHFPSPASPPWTFWPSEPSPCPQTLLVLCLLPAFASIIPSAWNVSPSLPHSTRSASFFGIPNPSRNIRPLWVPSCVSLLTYLHRNVILLEFHLLKEAFPDYRHPDTSLVTFPPSPKFPRHLCGLQDWPNTEKCSGEGFSWWMVLSVEGIL